MRWTLRIVESRYPHGFTLDVHGDFLGRGVCTLAQEGPRVIVTFDWKVRTTKPLMAILSPVLKPGPVASRPLLLGGVGVGVGLAAAAAAAAVALRDQTATSTPGDNR